MAQKANTHSGQCQTVVKTPHPKMLSYHPETINEQTGLEYRTVLAIVTVRTASFSAASGSFNSLSKVLFIFPSRYLFAIGFPYLFIPSMKFTIQFALHSRETRLSKKRAVCDLQQANTGLSPFIALFPTRLLLEPDAGSHPSTLQFTWNNTPSDFQFEFFPVRSQLLKESLLVTVTPPTNMLKFSGCPRSSSSPK
jgi:hypothetical protein